MAADQLSRESAAQHIPATTRRRRRRAPASGLAGRNRRREFWPAERATDEIGSDIGRPYDREEEEDRRSARHSRPAQQGERDAGEPGIGQPPAAPLTCLRRIPSATAITATAEQADSTRSAGNPRQARPARRRAGPRQPYAAASGGDRLLARHRAPFIKDRRCNRGGQQPERQPAQPVRQQTTAAKDAERMRSCRLLMALPPFGTIAGCRRAHHAAETTFAPAAY